MPMPGAEAAGAAVDRRDHTAQEDASFSVTRHANHQSNRKV